VGEAAATVHDDLSPAAPPASLGLVSEWDSALTYDALEGQDDPGGFDAGVFVGRRELLGPLVNAIGNPDRRGTYLISGYRGAGKTSMVIQAAKDAKPLLEQRGFHLLPLVLNVSEVSASLTAASEPDAPPLGIDARRLLTALIRALRNGLRALPQERDLGSVLKLVGQAYEKAEASSYAEKLSQRREVSAARKVESSRSFDVANVFKLVAVLAGLGAAVVEGVALLGTSLAALQIPVLALAGVAVFSFHRSTVTTQNSSETADSAIELSRDNSLHQVETDLKEILSRLSRNKQLRMIFVLEELDKVEDEDGMQLDAVIRYFKNLFTQAPALFFFLTDKAYLDLIDKKIAASRRQRSYAVEHTFFTHRVFVGRPSLDECLDYFTRVLAGPLPDVQVALDEIRASQASRARPLEAMSPIERFLRVLLFVSQNHLFDLKDEMRGYLHTGEDGSRLEFGGDAFPEGLAAFHFLLEQKMRLFGFGASRQYTGEVLRNSLSAVFAELGTSAVQSVEDLTADQEAGLDWAERKRIRDAVYSLLDDLARGGAISIDAVAGSGEGTSFVWRPSAEVVFSPAPQLEAHEKAFVEQLERALRVCQQFGPDGPLREVGDQSSALRVIERYRDMAKEVNTAQEPLSAEETQRRSRALRASSRRSWWSRGRTTSSACSRGTGR